MNGARRRGPGKGANACSAHCSGTKGGVRDGGDGNAGVMPGDTSYILMR